MSTLMAYQALPGDRVNVGDRFVTVETVTRRDSEWVSNGVVYFRATDGHKYGVDRYHDIERESEEDYVRACDAQHAADPWLQGLEFDTAQVNRSKHARRARSGRIKP